MAIALQSIQSPQTTSPDPVPSAAAEPSQPAALAPGAAPADAVKLSISQEAHNLLHQGTSVAQIAADLGTNTATIDSYLSITPTPAPAPSSSGHAAAHSAAQPAAPASKSPAPAPQPQAPVPAAKS